MKRFLFLGVVFICLFVHAVFGDDKYDGGIGTEGDPYQIATAAQLHALGQDPNNWDKCFILTADVDMNPDLLGEGVVTSPIGNNSQPFSGVFDGNGHVISNLTINLPESVNVGLFGCLSGYVKKLGLENVDIVGKQVVGGLAGLCDSTTGSSITECFVTGSVAGSTTDSFTRVGGLVGSILTYGDTGNVSDCYSRASVSGLTRVNGLIGFISQNITINNCYSSGTSEHDPSKAYEGGIVGVIVSQTEVSNSFWDADTSGTKYSSAGIALNTVFMKSMSIYSFAGWSGDVWTIDDGNDYPRLAWENKPGEPIADQSTVLEGEGTSDDPYLISTNTDLMIISRFEELWDKHFLLKSDLDVDGLYFTPIGYHKSPNYYAKFTGLFDGGGHVISNLSMQIYFRSQAGLFGFIGTGGVVRDLGLENISIISDYSSGTYENGVGGLAGCVEGGYVSQCYTSGVVRDILNMGGAVGGLVGSCTDDTEIINCYSRCSVTGGYYATGGLVGMCLNSTVLSSYSAGTLERLDGGVPRGLIGYADESEIIDCFVEIEIPGTIRVYYGAGRHTAQMKNPAVYQFAGWDGDVWTIDAGNDYPRLAWENAEGESIGEYTWDGSAENPVAISNAWELLELHNKAEYLDKHIVLTADIDMDPEITGVELIYDSLIAPYQGSWNESSKFSGIFDGRGHVISNLNIKSYGLYNGLFGIIWGGEVKNLGMENCNIDGKDFVGGLAGRVMGKISRCYFIGSVKGWSRVGGFLGFPSDSEISDCYSRGTVDGVSGAGGFVGYIKNTTISRCYSTSEIIAQEGAGFCLSHGGGVEIIDCFWDTQRSGTSDGVGNVDPDPDGVVGLTTWEMFMVSTFTDAGWDLVGESVNGSADVWRLCGDGYSYPRLAWEYSRRGDFACGEGVDAADLGLLAADWLNEGQSQADANFDGKVDIEDMVVLARYWLSEALSPEGPEHIAIDPVTGVTASSELGISYGRVDDHIVDGSGMIAGKHTCEATGSMWLSSGDGHGGVDDDPSVTFDLGAVYTITSFHVWNYNQVVGGISYDLRGVNGVSVEYGVTPSLGSTVEGITNFARASGQNWDAGEVFDDFEPFNARYIKFDINSNHGDAKFFYGLSEVRFYGEISE